MICYQEVTFLLTELHLLLLACLNYLYFPDKFEHCWSLISLSCPFPLLKESLHTLISIFFAFKCCYSIDTTDVMEPGGGVGGLNRVQAKQQSGGLYWIKSWECTGWDKVRYSVHGSTTGQNPLPGVRRSFRASTDIQHHVCQPLASANWSTQLEFRGKDNSAEIHKTQWKSWHILSQASRFLIMGMTKTWLLSVWWGNLGKCPASLLQDFPGP